jgi:hypothetical protein
MGQPKLARKGGKAEVGDEDKKHCTGRGAYMYVVLVRSIQSSDHSAGKTNSIIRLLLNLSPTLCNPAP